ncbi:MAG: glycine cleavage T C-terminal barrel domain-containing protein [Rhodospirillales bacterium]
MTARRSAPSPAAATSPPLAAPVAMGYVTAAAAAPGTAVSLLVRGKALDGEVVPLPFVPHRYVK